jgi:hypothetical protein
MKTTTSLIFLLLGLAVSPAFGNSIDLTGKGQAGSGACTAASPCLFGYSQYYLPNGNFVREGGFSILGSEGSGHYASGEVDALSYVLQKGGPFAAFSVNGTLSNVYFNSSTDVLTAAFNGTVGFVGFGYTNITGTFQANLNPVNGTLGGAYIFTNQYQSVNMAPEPGTLALMGTGLCGILGTVRRKLKRG